MRSKTYSNKDQSVFFFRVKGSITGIYLHTDNLFKKLYFMFRGYRVQKSAITIIIFDTNVQLYYYGWTFLV